MNKRQYFLSWLFPAIFNVILNILQTYRHTMCSKLCGIYQRTTIIAISAAGHFIGWSNKLNCLNIFLILLCFEKKKMKKKSEFNKTLFFLLHLLSKILFMYPMISFRRIKKVHNRLWDRSVLTAKFSISLSCLCLHFFTVYKQDNYLDNELMSHSNNLGNVKVRGTFTTRKQPSLSPIL